MCRHPGAGYTLHSFNKNQENDYSRTKKKEVRKPAEIFTLCDYVQDLLALRAWGSVFSQMWGGAQWTRSPWGPGDGLVGSDGKAEGRCEFKGKIKRVYVW